MLSSGVIATQQFKRQRLLEQLAQSKNLQVVFKRVGVHGGVRVLGHRQHPPSLGIRYPLDIFARDSEFDSGWKRVSR